MTHGESPREKITAYLGVLADGPRCKPEGWQGPRELHGARTVRTAPGLE